MSLLLDFALHSYTFIYVPLLFWNSTTFYSIFNAHPVLMSLMFSLTGYAIAVFRPVYQDEQQQQKKKPKADKNKLVKKNFADLHGTVMFGALTSLLVAFGAIEYSKFVNNYSHFKSWHGIVGFIAVFVMLTQFTFGAMMNKQPQLMMGLLKRFGIKFLDGWKYHAQNGAVLLTVMYAVLVMGYYTNWMAEQSNLYAGIKLEIGERVVSYGDIFWGTGMTLITYIWLTAVQQVFTGIV